MNQFITLTRTSSIKIKINVSHIISYEPGVRDNFAIVCLSGGITHHVWQTPEYIDLLIHGEGNTNSMRMATREKGKSKLPFNETPRANP